MIKQHRGVAQPGSAPGLGPGGREFESRRPDHEQKRPWLNWIEHRPSKPGVAGSSPAGRALFDKLLGLYFNYGGYSSVGRAPDCDSGCRGFESH